MSLPLQCNISILSILSTQFFNNSPYIGIGLVEFIIHYRINENELEIHKIYTYGLFLKDGEIKKYSYGVSYYDK